MTGPDVTGPVVTGPDVTGEPATVVTPRATGGPPRPSHALRWVLGAVVAGAAVTGCSSPDPSDPTPSGPSASATASTDASTSTGPTTPTLQDRGEEVVGGAAAPAAIATTKAKTSSSYAGATFTILGLTRTDSSTLLTWRVTGGSDAANGSDANVRGWERYPIMVAGGKEYSVVTFDKAADGWSALSDPALRVRTGQVSPPQYALYPPLAKGTTTVTLKGDWFADVKVPVTDATS